MTAHDSLFSLRSLTNPDRLHADDWVWITPDERDALVEAVRAAKGIYGIPKTFLSVHHEADEITCNCGFQSQSVDYDKARRALRDHIYREEKKILDNAAKKHGRLDDALAAFDD